MRGVSTALALAGSLFLLLILFVEFLEYISEWKHAKHLIGTCLSWFLTNIAYVELTKPYVPLLLHIFSLGFSA